ncbi:MAG: hypothetical protein U0T02_01455 [Solirubrobacteraceae bacterium]
MSRRVTVSLLVALSLCVLAAPATAARPKHVSRAWAPIANLAAGSIPTVSSVRPLRVRIGGKLTVRGRNFVPGRGRTTVVFLRSGAPAIFARANDATFTTLTVTVPRKLGGYLGRRGGKAVETRFAIRVLGRRFAKDQTPRKLSPRVAPASGTAPVANTCLRNAKSQPGGDIDHDLLSNASEIKYKTDPCNADSDGDGVTDGYEFNSALDLNSRALPYPGKRPYPNALDPTDKNIDFDGDGLTLTDEFNAWVKFGARKLPLNYSDGTQNTGGPIPVTPATASLDLNGDGTLSDDERDIDNDGLGNWVEAHGPMSGQPWWTAMYEDEKPFTVPLKGTDWLDADTDGDGLKDGADDVDHDGWANQDEIARTAYWVQPFNPCLPDYGSPTCPLHPPLPKESYPPFDDKSPKPLPPPPIPIGFLGGP